MAVVQCINKHHYDNEKHSECPFCSSGLPHVSSVRESQQILQYAEEYVRNYEASHGGQEAAGHAGQEDLAGNVSSPGWQEQGHEGQPASAARREDSTGYAFSSRQKVSAHGSQPDFSERNAAGHAGRSIFAGRKSAGHAGQLSFAGQEAVSRTGRTPAADQPPFASRPSSARPSRPLSWKPEEDDERTVSFRQMKQNVNPTAGWLVCVEGEDFGRSFEIKVGRNLIGRAADMDIVLHGDSGIAARGHAAIFYEPKKREFFVQAAEAVDLNGGAVLQPQKLKARDILKAGNTRLMFIPCCGSDFGWDEGSALL